MSRPNTGLDIPILTDATHTLLQAFRQLPGSSWIESAADSGADWIGNAAKEPGASIFLDAISGSLFSALASVSIPLTNGALTIGPQLASVVFALPGVVAGKDFTTAYIQDLTSRIISTAAILAANPALATAAANSFSPAIAQSINSIAANVTAATSAGTTALSAAQTSAYNLAMSNAVSSGITTPLANTIALPSFHALLDPILQKVGANAGVPALRAALRDAGATAEDLAHKFGIRPDVAALAVNQYTQTPVYDAGAPPPAGASEFDVNGQPNANYTQKEAAIGAPLPDVALAQAQRALSTLGLLDVFALGVAGPSTTAAMQAFQATHSLPITGLPDDATLSALEAAVIKAPLALASTPVQDAKYAASQRQVSDLLANARGSATALSASPLEDALGVLLKATLVTSPIWFSLFILPKFLGGPNVRAKGNGRSAQMRGRRQRARGRRFT